jgi:ABC-type multidrug transport system fused ATPase/permease subunit
LEEIDMNDPQAMAIIYQILDKEFSNKTIIIIAQYLQTILQCDRVLVMDNGRILEFDSPLTLMNNQESNLRKMWTDELIDKGTYNKSILHVT